MTKERPEIVIEGSRDGVEWRAYRFEDKPLELERAPVFAGLHMPRLDWQLWFAALEADRPYRSSWYASFLTRLLEGALRESLARARRVAGKSEPVRLVTVRGRGTLPGVDLDDSAALLEVMESGPKP